MWLTEYRLNMEKVKEDFQVSWLSTQWEDGVI